MQKRKLAGNLEGGGQPAAKKEYDEEVDYSYFNKDGTQEVLEEIN